MHACSKFSLAVLALSFVSLTGCAHLSSQVTATGLSGANSPVMQAMEAAGNAGTVEASAEAPATRYVKRAASPIEAAMTQAQGGYAKQAK